MPNESTANPAVQPSLDDQPTPPFVIAFARREPAPPSPDTPESGQDDEASR